MSKITKITLSDNTSIELSNRGSTGLVGVWYWSSGRGNSEYEFESAVSLDDIHHSDDRVYDLPAGARIGGDASLILGGSNDPRKSAYRRAYFINNVSAVLDAFYTAYPHSEDRTFSAWVKFDFVPSYPSDLFTALPDMVEAIRASKPVKVSRISLATYTPDQNLAFIAESKVKLSIDDAVAQLLVSGGLVTAAFIRARLNGADLSEVREVIADCVAESKSEPQIAELVTELYA